MSTPTRRGRPRKYEGSLKERHKQSRRALLQRNPNHYKDYWHNYRKHGIRVRDINPPKPKERRPRPDPHVCQKCGGRRTKGVSWRCENGKECFSWLYIHSILTYHPLTGEFTHLRTGNPLGVVSKTHGYVFISLQGSNYHAHRLAWLYVHREWPKGQIDHENGIKHDNRFSNLRATENGGNQHARGLRKNNTSGKKGVTRHPDGVRWKAAIGCNNRTYLLGTFDNLDEAAAAYDSKAVELFGAMARTNADLAKTGTVQDA